MKRSSIKRCGKVGKANIEARKLIAEVAEEYGLNYCEIQMENCLGHMYLAPAHRHKRAWYKGNVELLAEYTQWISACVNCHNDIEHNKELTEQEFIRLRGEA